MNTESQFVGLGEIMLRETPSDHERLERTRQVWLSPAGAEFNVAVGVARLGISSAIVSRLPANPLGKLLKGIAREHGVSDRFIVDAPADELLARMAYDPGVAPRAGAVYYQRKYSAASKLQANEVDWSRLLSSATVFHTTGITLGLTAHSGYERNYLLECLQAAIASKPKECRIAFDLNYRSTLWSKEAARRTIEPVLLDKTDILFTSVEDLASFFEMRSPKYSSAELLSLSNESLPDEEFIAVAEETFKRFPLSLLILTRRYDYSSTNAGFESFIIDRKGSYARSATIKKFEVVDRIGGGDAWAAGFYSRMIPARFAAETFQEAVDYGDAAMQIHQTSMFDIPVINQQEVDALVKAGGHGTARIKR